MAGSPAGFPFGPDRRHPGRYAQTLRALTRGLAVVALALLTLMIAVVG